MTEPGRKYEAGFNWGVADLALDATSENASSANGTSVSHNHVVAVGAKQLYYGFHVSGTTDVVTSVTAGGNAMSLIGKIQISGTSTWVYLYGIINPPTGTIALVVNLSASRKVRGGAASWLGSSATLGTGVTATGTSTTPSVVVPSASDAIVMAVGGVGVSVTWAPGTGEVELWDSEQADSSNAAECSWGGREAGAASVTIQPTITGGAQAWGMVGVSIPSGFIDESSSLKHFTIKMGRSDETSKVEPTTAIIVLENIDGRFTPDYASGPLYGSIEVERRVRLRGYLSDNVTTKDLFYGFITDIEPDALNQRVTFHCQDWSMFLQAYSVNLGPYEGIAINTLIGSILNYAGFPTGGTWRTFDTALTALPYWMARNINGWDAIQELAEHELGGMFYFDQSGKAIFESRHARALKAVTNTFTNSIGMLTYRRRSSQVYSKAKIGLGGFEAGIAGSIIYSHSPLPLAVAAGALVGDSESGLNINYSQPARDVITPVPVVATVGDYAANASADGTGTDRTSGMTLVSFDSFGGGAQLKLRNDNLSTVYMTRLNVRGTPLGLGADLRTVERSGTALGTLHRTYEKQYRFLTDKVVAADFANYIVTHYATPQPLLETRLDADDSAIQQKLYESRLSDRETITDTAFPWRSNVNGDFFVEQITHEVDVPSEGEGIHRTGWTLTQYLNEQFWIMGVSLVGVDTIPGF